MRFVVAIPPRWAIVHVAFAVIVAFLAIAVPAVVSRTIDFRGIGIITILGLRPSEVVAVGVFLPVLEASALFTYHVDHVVHFLLRCRLEIAVGSKVDQVRCDVFVVQLVEDWII